MVGRRGPAQAACTAKELRELLGIVSFHCSEGRLFRQILLPSSNMLYHVKFLLVVLVSQFGFGSKWISPVIKIICVTYLLVFHIVIAYGSHTLNSRIFPPAGTKNLNVHIREADLVTSPADEVYAFGYT